MEKTLATSWESVVAALQEYFEAQQNLQAEADKAWEDLSASILQKGSDLVSASLSSGGDFDALEKLSDWAEDTESTINLLVESAKTDGNLTDIQKENIQNHAKELQDYLTELQNIWIKNF